MNDRPPGQPRILPPVYFLLALVAQYFLHSLLPIARLLTAPQKYLGAIPLLTGVAMAMWGAREFARRQTPIKPMEPSTVLVTSGLYRFTRNPMYLGMFMVLTGVAVLLGSASAWLPLPVFCLIIRYIFVSREEVILERIFGDQYRSYKMRARRWI